MGSLEIAGWLDEHMPLMPQASDSVPWQPIIIAVVLVVLVGVAYSARRSAPSVPTTLLAFLAMSGPFFPSWYALVMGGAAVLGVWYLYADNRHAKENRTYQRNLQQELMLAIQERN